MVIRNCLNCGAPISSTTVGAVCEYCGTTYNVDGINVKLELNGREFARAVYSEIKNHTCGGSSEKYTCV